MENKINRAKSLIQKSVTVDEDFKEMVCRQLPKMKEDDIDRLIEIFSQEEAAFKTVRSELTEEEGDKTGI